MRELIRFGLYLKQRWFIWVLVPLVTLVLCYFLASRLPDVYRSKGSIATGLVDKTGQILSLNENVEQDSELNRKFENLIQLIKLKKVLDQVSYRLVIHDLTARPGQAFREVPDDADQGFREKAVVLLRRKLSGSEAFYPSGKEEQRVAALIEDMGYDAGSILEKLRVERISNSDYIEVEFEAEHPGLSAYLVNTLISEFLKVYAERIKGSSEKSLDFLEKFMLQKLAALNQKMEELKDFKIRNRVLNLNEQARSLYGHIIDFETRREITKKDIIAYGAALKNIDARFNPADRQYLEGSMALINQHIAETREELKAVNDLYIRSNFNPAYKARVDSVQKVLSARIMESSDKYIYNPLNVKENLVNHKLELEISLELARNSIKTIEDEIRRLNGKFDGMVPSEASIQQYETSIDIAGKEYIEALQRYNSARLESFNPIALKQVEKASDGIKLPSKKRILVLLSGLVSLIVCLFVLFVLYYLDNAIRIPQQLADQTGAPVLGHLNRVRDFTDPGQLDGAKPEGPIARFRSLVRSVRFEIDSEGYGPKIIAVTSLTEGSGKTLVVNGLAWAYRRINRRVLVIDGNFGNPDLTKERRNMVYLEDFLAGKELHPDSANPAVLGTRGGDVSLLELVDEKQLQSKLATLRAQFDVVIVETGSLRSLHKAKEWLTYADRVIGVFPAGRPLGERDEENVRYLRNRGAVFAGWVLTQADASVWGGSTNEEK
ncbi:hypothetical protein GCM10023091_32690 [Ravibacter arvi]|uniref:Lipopolysaccharide biosynthesis protein n=1 Tax=Ravibacter arvi TaxID=2051041 RepID=A0ABP8M4H0_9BACT